MTKHRVLVVGARRRHQGIGEFIARSFKESGAHVCAVVGTSQNTVDEALTNLKTRWEISAAGYTDLPTAIQEQAPSIVALCSPHVLHRQHLQTVLDHGLHCLCEKPLIWQAGEVYDLEEVARIANDFHRQKKLLRLVTQWPLTLDEYFTLFPEVKPQPPRHFKMLMGPAYAGWQGIADSLPHVISMVHALTGIGAVQKVEMICKDPERIEFSFEYQHDRGMLVVEVSLIRTPNPPRPAGYAINGFFAQRTIKLPEYQFLFGNEEGRQVPMQDPLLKLIQSFLEAVEDRRETQKDLIVASMVDLKAITENINLE